MRYRAILTLLLTVALASACYAVDTGSMDPTDYLGQPVMPERNNTFNSQGFQDLLDVPAAKTEMAVKSLLNGVTLAGSRLVSVGIHGHIIYSDDGGTRWTQAKVPVSSDLTAVHFPTPKKGWAVGNDGVVLHSEDGGASWIKQFDGRAAAQVVKTYYTQNPVKDAERIIQRYSLADEGGQDKVILDVWFENETTGFIVGDFSLIFQTTDGGKNWVPWNHRIDNPNNSHLMSIRHIEQGLYISGERGLLLKLDQKTGKFTKLSTSYNGSFFGIIGKPGVLVAFGLRGHIFVSRNGGGSWQEVASGTDIGLMGGTVTEDGRIILVSSTGQILISADNAASFKLLAQSNPMPASAVGAIGNNKIIIVGQNGLQLQPLK